MCIYGCVWQSYVAWSIYSSLAHCFSIEYKSNLFEVRRRNSYMAYLQVLIEPTLDVDPMIGLAHYSIDCMVVMLVHE